MSRVRTPLPAPTRPPPSPPRSPAPRRPAPGLGGSRSPAGSAAPRPPTARLRPEFARCSTAGTQVRTAPRRRLAPSPLPPRTPLQTPGGTGTGPHCGRPPGALHRFHGLLRRAGTPLAVCERVVELRRSSKGIVVDLFDQAQDADGVVPPFEISVEDRNSDRLLALASQQADQLGFGLRVPGQKVPLSLGRTARRIDLSPTHESVPAPFSGRRTLDRRVPAQSAPGGRSRSPRRPASGDR